MSKALQSIGEIAAGAALIAVDLLVPGAAAFSSILIGTGASLIMAGIATALTKQVGQGVNVRNPVQPRNVVYGQAKVGGTAVFLHEWGDNNKYYSMVFVLACHQCQSFDGVVFDDRRVPLDGSGNSNTPVQWSSGIASISRVNDVVTVTLVTPFVGLGVGDPLVIKNITTDATLNGTYTVQTVPVTSTTFTFINGGTAITLTGEGTAGTAWPDYGDTIHCEALLGDQTSTWSSLISDSGGLWTANHILKGHTCVYLRLKYGGNTYASGIPNIAFLLHGKNDIADPRTGTSGYTENSALCIADYLSNPTWGYGCTIGTDIPVAPLIAAANICDEAVTTASGNAEPRYGCNGGFQLSETRGSVLQSMLSSCGGRLTVTGGQYIIHPAAWPGISVAIGSNNIVVDARCIPWTTDIATNPQVPGSMNLIKGLPPKVSSVPLTPGQSVIVSYLSGLCSIGPGFGFGFFDAAGDPGSGSSVSTFMGWSTLGDAGLCGAFTDSTGHVIEALDIGLGGTFTVPAGASQIQFGTNDGSEWFDNVGSFNISVGIAGDALQLPFYQNAAGPFEWKPKLSVRELYNGVKGSHTSAANSWNVSDYPSYCQDVTHGYGSDVNLAADGGDRRWKDLALPFTRSSSTAQRLAKIELMRIRQQGKGTFAFNMAFYELAALDVITLAVPVLGWDQKVLEVASSRFTLNKQNASGQDVTLLGTEIDVQETDPSVYEWSTSEELTPEGFPQGSQGAVVLTSVPAVKTAAVPTSLAATSGSGTSVVGADGIARSQILVTWTAPVDGYVTNGGQIQIQYQKVGDTTWTALPSVDPSVAQAYISNVVDGTAYNVEIRSVNVAGAFSGWVEYGPITASGTTSVIQATSISAAGSSAGQVLTSVGGSWVATTPPGTITETPTGTLDGTNVTFTLSNTPQAGSLELRLNGIGQVVTTDFTISANTITYTVAPKSDDVHVAEYTH